MKRWLAITALVAAAATGCGGEVERKYMKLSGTYTAQDLRRDISACTKDKVLSDPCMQDRGWVVMNPARDDQKNPREAEAAQRTPMRRY
jgi:hypothetical protein